MSSLLGALGLRKGFPVLTSRSYSTLEQSPEFMVKSLSRFPFAYLACLAGDSSAEFWPAKHGLWPTKHAKHAKIQKRLSALISRVANRFPGVREPVIFNFGAIARVYD